jgi:hypothetical protein
MRRVKVIVRFARSAGWRLVLSEEDEGETEIFSVT